MHLNCSHIKDFAFRSLCLGILLLCSDGGRAAETAGIGKLAQNLPDLPGANQPAPGHFSLDEQSAAVGYDSRMEKWGAKIDGYSDLPSVTLDYGMLLTNSFGAGATFSHQSDYSEVLVNGVYAPAPNVRLRLTGGQLRAVDNASPGPGSASNAASQSSYLLDLKRYWNKDRLLSDLGVAAYTVYANEPDYADISALTGAGGYDPGSAESGAAAPGRLDGYMLHLGLRPMSRSRIEFKRATSRLSYAFDDGMREERFASSQLRYSQYFGDCTRLQGRYSSNPNADRLDLSLAKDSWSIDLSRALDENGGDMSVRIGYAIALGKRGGAARECGAEMESPRPLKALVDAAIARPYQLPREPLSRIDAASISEPMAQ